MKLISILSCSITNNTRYIFYTPARPILAILYNKYIYKLMINNKQMTCNDFYFSINLNFHLYSDLDKEVFCSLFLPVMHI